METIAFRQDEEHLTNDLVLWFAENSAGQLSGEDCQQLARHLLRTYALYMPHMVGVWQLPESATIKPTEPMDIALA
jgi:hypothetical protein